MTPLLLALALGCTVGTEGPATPGSPAATEAAAVGDIAARAAEIQALSHALTSLVDESRRQVADGRSTRAAEIAKMRDLVAQIEEKNAALQAEVAALEARVHDEAGDPAPPQEPEKGR